MVELFILWVLFLLYWNHKLYRTYATITYKTLYKNVRPTKFRDLLVEKQVKSKWIF